MIKTLTSFLVKPASLYAEVEVDHIELMDGRLTLGAEVKWTNTTPEALEIGGVMIKLYQRGKNETPLDFRYYGRFFRIPFQKAVVKTAGSKCFHVAAGATQTQFLRFLTTEVSDLGDGSYAAELHSTVPEGTYVHEFKLKVTAQVKYQASSSEPEKGQTGQLSSIYARAIRIGAN